MDRGRQRAASFCGGNSIERKRARVHNVDIRPASDIDAATRSALIEHDADAVTVPTSTHGHTEAAEDDDTDVPCCSTDDIKIDINSCCKCEREEPPDN